MTGNAPSHDRRARVLTEYDIAELRKGTLTENELEGFYQRIDESWGRLARSQDAQIAVLQVQQKSGDSDLTKTNGLLEKHITECAKLQKWAFGVLCGLAAWVVAHSPEAAKAMLKIIEAFA